MKKLLISALAVVLTAVGANAQLLWKVSGNGAKGDSYLFGTHHVAPIALLDSVGGFDRALAGADAVVGELDMAQAQGQEAQMAAMRWGMAPADSTLTAVLTPAEADSVNALMSRYSGGMLTNAVEQMAPMKPAVLSTQIAMMQNMKIFPGFSPAEQLDGAIQQRGLEAGKAVKALETVDEQMELLFGIPISLQAKELMKCVRDDESARGMELAREMAAAYMAQDLPKVAALMADPENMDAESAERLINARNAAWLAKLPDMMREQSVLVAVGAGHLTGPKGLIEGLRAAGFTVEPAGK